MRKIAIGGDHAGYSLKAKIIAHLTLLGYEVDDLGPFASDSVDYPDFVHPVAQSVSSGENPLGILICGSGNGVAMTANKYQDIRCGLCWREDIAQLTRQHNNANIVAIPARFVDVEQGLAIVDAFLEAKFEGGRHQRRVDKIIPEIVLQKRSSSP